jgi:hypothetical protein
MHNPQARVAHNYSCVDDLAQSPAAMSILEVLQTCPTQWEIDPMDTQLITFDLNSGEPHLPHSHHFSNPH